MKAQIIAYDGSVLAVKPDNVIDSELLKKSARSVTVVIEDGRHITDEQRKKIYALLNEISEWSGEWLEYTKESMKARYRILFDCEDFSFSPVATNAATVSLARNFITFLIDFCFHWGVPTKKPLFDLTDDIRSYLYLCLYYRKCAVCGTKADVHHIDTIGMGMDRQRTGHKGLKAIALCREHHQAAHVMGKSFFERYKLFPTELDEKLCDKLNLRKEFTKWQTEKATPKY